MKNSSSGGSRSDGTPAALSKSRSRNAKASPTGKAAATGSGAAASSRPPSIAPAGAAGAKSGASAATGKAAANAKAAPSSAPKSRGTKKNGKPKGKRFIDYPRFGKTGLRRWLPSWRLIFGTFATFIILVLGGFVYLYATTEIPTENALTQAQTTTVYYADGVTEMGKFSVQNRQKVDTNPDTNPAFPDYVRKAVVAAEDRTFYDNAGINPLAMGRAAWYSLRGGNTTGASTITQQFVKNTYLNSERTLSRKLQEAVLSIKVEQAQNKNQILDSYMNTIYFGRGAYGIQTAAQAYFGVDAQDLTISQAAMIAGIIPNPTNWDPRNNPEKAESRWNYVLDGMVTIGAITPEDRAAQVFPEVKPYTTSNLYAGPQGYLLDMVRKELTSVPAGATEAPFTEDQLDTGGYKIVTTIQKSVQDQAVQAVADMPADKPAALKVAIVTIDQSTGGIAALYGGPDFITQSRNAATQDVAQAGSTFKPFALVTGLEQGISLDTMYNGNNKIPVPGWDNPPRNYSGISYGQIPLYYATAQSVNTVYAQLNDQVGPQNTMETAIKAGYPENTSGLEANPANVLGSASPHPIDVATAYATFAAQGVKHTTHIVASVSKIDTSGQEEVKYTADVAGERVFAEDVMADTTYALTQVVQQGTAKSVKAVGVPVAGKTGTSTDNKSAWFVGFTGQYTTALALYQGDDAGNEVTITPFAGYSEITGGSVPAKMWAGYMKAVQADLPVIQFPGRANIGKATEAPVQDTATVEPTPTQDAPATVEPTTAPTTPPAPIQTPPPATTPPPTVAPTPTPTPTPPAPTPTPSATPQPPAVQGQAGQGQSGQG